MYLTIFIAGSILEPVMKPLISVGCLVASIVDIKPQMEIVFTTGLIIQQADIDFMSLSLLRFY